MSYTGVTLPFTVCGSCIDAGTNHPCCCDASSFYVPCFACVSICCTRAFVTVDSYDTKSGVACFTANVCHCMAFTGCYTAFGNPCYATCVEIVLQNESGCCCVSSDCCVHIISKTTPTACCLALPNDFTFSYCLPTSFKTENWCFTACVKRQAINIRGTIETGNNATSVVKVPWEGGTGLIDGTCRFQCVNTSSFYIPCCIHTCFCEIESTVSIDGGEGTQCMCFTANTCFLTCTVGQKPCTLCVQRCVTYCLLNESGCVCCMYYNAETDNFTFCCCNCCTLTFQNNDSWCSSLPTSYACECVCVAVCLGYRVVNFATGPVASANIGGAYAFKIKFDPGRGLEFSFNF